MIIFIQGFINLFRKYICQSTFQLANQNSVFLKICKLQLLLIPVNRPSFPMRDWVQPKLDNTSILPQCENEVQFQVMNLNFTTNFVTLNKHIELLNKYLLELVVKWNLFEHRVKLI